jgi:hypothetical protein
VSEKKGNSIIFLSSFHYTNQTINPLDLLWLQCMTMMILLYRIHDKKSHPFNDIKPFISDKKKYHTNTFKTSFIHHLIPEIDAKYTKWSSTIIKIYRPEESFLI